MRTPVSTYRLQIRPGFTLQDAAERAVPEALGVDWVYLSPMLTAEQGSDHGYDVTDPSAVDPDRGGADGLLARVAGGAGRRHGRAGRHRAQPRRRGHPGAEPVVVGAAEGGRGSRRYAAGVRRRLGLRRRPDPAPGAGRRTPTLDDAARSRTASCATTTTASRSPRAPYATVTPPQEVHDRQHYELMNWRRADAELNYRRFFAVTTPGRDPGRDPRVFDEAHAEIGRWFREGLVDGLRIDHPDGLADPGGLPAPAARTLTGGAYVLVEKILEPGEELPAGFDVRGHHRLRRPRRRGPALHRPGRAEARLTPWTPQLRGGSPPTSRT